MKKIGPVLDLFSVENPEWGVTEVGERLSIAKSSAHALLASLADVGLLSCTRQSRYRLGWRFLDLGETLMASLDLRLAALPAMQKLAEQHRETVQLAVLDRGRVLFVERLEGTHPVRFSGAAVGARWPSHANASGKVLLASRPRGEVARIANAEGLRAMTSRTLTDVDVLHDELERVRRLGYAVDVEESVAGVSSLAAPIRLERGVTIAAVSVAVPTSRFSSHERALRNAVFEAAAEISRSTNRAAEAHGDVVVAEVAV